MRRIIVCQYYDDGSAEDRLKEAAELKQSTMPTDGWAGASKGANWADRASKLRSFQQESLAGNLDVCSGTPAKGACWGHRPIGPQK